MTTLRHEHRHLDVACELDNADAGDRVAEWARLRANHGLGAEPITGGIRLWLRPEGRGAAADLVGREAACCGFLDLELAADDDRLRLDITSPASEASPVIAFLAGLEADCELPCC
ncbi:MAG TPA: hypothetical protein VFH70_13335 [Acidimicrobiales bacterium]|nr:hypothetical protein [Acidimicrobiales bacterium]